MMASSQTGVRSLEAEETLSHQSGDPVSPAARAVDLTKTYGSGDAVVRALAGVDLEFGRGRLHRRHGPVGVGQVDADALHGGAGPADVGAQLRGATRRSAPSTTPA